ncbi:anti-sigma regulatory factor [Oscillatoria laete-virens NRMC-F 0139]|nr:anti-sigma regulatory factor [Oscillatoria laete-virens]MDL5055187.1 anti-sigma regulatory factor [Oscillatoria laete-virens NRMC-F 0139]
MLQQAYLTVKSDLSLLNQVQEWFEQFWEDNLQERVWPENQLYRLQLALAEGFTNAVRHAHHNLSPETPIDLELTLWEDRLEIRIWDRGQPFNPDGLTEPEPGELREGGMAGFYCDA